MRRGIQVTAGGLLAAFVAVSALLLPGPSRAAGVPVVSAQAQVAYRLVDRWRSPTGTLPAGYLRSPAGVAVAESGDVFVTDSGQHQVHVFRGLSWVATWGRSGAQPGEFSGPRGIVELAGRVYVADTGNARIQVFDTVGNHVESWPGIGRPTGLAALGTTRLAVADAAGDRVVIVDLQGRQRETLGSSGSGPGQFSRPGGVAAWPDGHLAVVDEGNDRVQLFAPDGSVLWELPNPSVLPLRDVAALGEGGLVVAGMRTMFRLDRETGRFLTSTRAEVPGGFLAVGAQRTITGTYGPPIWAALEWHSRTGLRRFSADMFLQSDTWLELPAAPGVLVAPRRIHAAPDAFHILDAWPRAQRLSLGGRALDQDTLPPAEEVVAAGTVRYLSSGDSVTSVVGSVEGGAWRARDEGAWSAGLARDATSGLLYTLDLRGQSLVRLDPSLSVTATFPLSTTGFQMYTDLDLMPDGSLALVNRSRSEVEFRTVEGGLVNRWPVRGVPVRAAPAADGGVYVLTREGWVWQLDSGGRVAAWWDAAADAVGRRGAPSDIAVAADGRVLLTDSRTNEILVYEVDPSAEPPQQPTGEGCSFIRDKWASPPVIRLGDSVGVTLTVAGSCADQGLGADIMLVIDRSGSMEGQKIAAAHGAAVAFVGEIDFTVSRVGIVYFNSDVELAMGLSDQPSELVGAVATGPGAAGGTDIGEGIEVAAAELAAFGRLGAEQIIVVMTDGRPEGPVVDAESAASAAKAAGMRIYSIGFGTDVDPELMRAVASRPEDYFFAPGAQDLAGVYTEIARRITGGIVMRTAVITDVVPSNMVLVTGSAVPPPVSFVDRVLTWEFSNVRDDLVLSYKLRPLEVGTWPTNDEAHLRYVDGLDVPGRMPFPVPQVTVLAPPDPIYLPALAKRYCVPRAVHADIVLVLDTSSSMAGDKLAAAKVAARSFLNGLRLEGDRAAVVAFHADAFLAQGLTGDLAALRRAVDALEFSYGTAIEVGLSLALTELTGERRNPGHRPVLVLMTDGVNNAGHGPVLEAAARAAGEGVIVYTVAFGVDADIDLMGQVAGDPRRAFVAPSAEDLDRIYEEIAAALPCE